MSEFILLCHDKDGAAAVRKETRPAHLDYIAAAGDSVLLAGPILNDAGEPKGSMLVIRADNEAAALAFADADPYARAGLFKSVEINPFRIAAGTLAPSS